MQFNSKTLSELFDRRVQAIRSMSATKAGYRSADALILPILRLAEEVLQEHCGQEHYELSVWATPAKPEIIAYYDSARQERARTYAERQRNPLFYRQQGYEVIRLLDHPDTKPIVKTRLSAQKYRYQGPKQVKNIKSTILYCFDQARPAALVVTSADPKAFVGRCREVAVETLRCLSLCIRADLDMLQATQLPSSAEPRRDFAYAWLHLSDIHFGAGREDHRVDRDLVGAALLKDVSNFSGANIHRIFITGDIAFRGAQNEYRLAAHWIRRLAKIAKVGLEAVRLVPGNHDVDRNVISKKWKEAAKSVRTDPRVLTTELTKSREALLKRVENYSEFVSGLSRAHPKDEAGWVCDWAEDDVCTDGSHELKLRIAGLSTVWISDEDDGGGAGKNAKFTPNMALALSQLALLSRDDGSPHDIVFLLTHHPPEWLFQKSRDDLSRMLNDHDHIHLCGHIHKSEATHGWVFGRKRGAFRLSAGAAHDEDPKLNLHRGEHGYSWGALRRTVEGDWQLGWAPRVYVPSLNSFRADKTRFDLDEQGFAWETLQKNP
jgi:hypothetical protein